MGKKNYLSMTDHDSAVTPWCMQQLKQVVAKIMLQVRKLYILQVTIFEME